MKYKSIFLEFLKERKSVVILFIINTIFIFSFYRFTVSNKAEIIYPMIITVFLLCLFLIQDFYKYYSLLRKISDFSDKSIISSGTYLEEKILEAFSLEANKRIDSTNDIKSKYEARERFLIESIHKLKNNIAVAETTLETINFNKVNNFDDRINFPQEKIDILMEETVAIKDILKNTLSYIRLGSFNEDFHIKVINLYKEIQNIINENKKLFISSEVFPKIEIDDKEIKVITDVKWNRVLLEQLISNAIKYSKIENREVLFRCYTENDKSILEIIDNGIGIPKYDLKKVFNPYFTGENGRKNSKASGIGLFIVKKICEALNQEIQILSKVNEGTTVKISYLSKL